MSVAKAATDVGNPGSVPSLASDTVIPCSNSARPRSQSLSTATNVSGAVTRRAIRRASAAGAMTLSATPPLMMPMLMVVSPRSGSLGSLSDSSSASRRTSSLMADLPRCGYAEWAAVPRVRSAKRIAPLVPVASVLSVGSPLMRTLEVVGTLLAASAPSCVTSSPTTNNNATGTDSARKRSAAKIMDAAIPLASHAPRPHSVSPSSRGGMYGGTVSRCVESVTSGFSALVARIASRPGVTGMRRVVHPAPFR